MRVLLIHGIDDTGSIFRFLEKDLLAAGHDVLAPEYAPNDGRVRLEDAAELVVRAVAAWNDPPEPLAVVAFSMGGLIARYILQLGGGIGDVRLLYTVSTPHQGTHSAFFRPGAGVLQMRCGSDFIRELQATEDRLAGMRLISCWTPFDLMIIPATSSRWSIAENRTFPVVLHPWMLRARGVREDIVTTVGEVAGGDVLSEGRG